MACIRRCVIPVLAALVFFCAAHARAAGIGLNEILFSPAGADTGGEWIELYNAGDAPENMTGWQLNPDGIGYFLFPSGFSLAPKSFVTVHLRQTGASTARDLYHFSSALKDNMGNASGFAALFSGEPGKETIKSYVEWGAAKQTWESAAADAGLWERGAFVATTSVMEGSSIGLSSDGAWVGGQSAWSVFSIPSPGSGNRTAVQSEAAAPSPPLPAPASGGSSAAVSPSASAETGPTIHVSAGGDRSVAAGSETDFFGKVTGLKGDPLQNARFLWNFGDGEVRDGRALSHIFPIPGLYTVGLHVTSGIDVSSDYIRVLVVPNKIAIANVIEGDSGYVRLKNSGDVETDVGGWVLEDGAGRRFFLPAQSKVAPGAEVAFANGVTGLLKTPGSSVFALYYPNMILAGRWSGRPPEAEKAEMKTGGTVFAKGSTRPLLSAAAGSGTASAGMIPASTRRVSPASATTSRRHGTSSAASLRQGTHNLFFWVAALAGAGAAAGFFLVKFFL